jgi:hypothetical protein
MEAVKAARAARDVARDIHRAEEEGLMFQQDLTHWLEEPGVAEEP